MIKLNNFTVWSYNHTKVEIFIKGNELIHYSDRVTPKEISHIDEYGTSRNKIHFKRIANFTRRMVKYL